MNWHSFQSTPPRGRATRRSDRLARSIARVSIHAPRVGGRRNAIQIAEAQGVSIHAPACRATARPSCWAAAATSFNPRPRVGSLTVNRAWWPPCLSSRGFQHVHAPAWAGDSDGPWFSAARKAASFNPRPRVANSGDCAGCQDRLVPHRGFNPRPRVRGRHDSGPSMETRSPSGVSIHAPAWATCNRVATERSRSTTIKVFNPRPRVGGRQLLGRLKPWTPTMSTVSIHAPPRA